MKYIDTPTAKTIATTLIASKLDYCNAVLTGKTQKNIKRLQRIQNAVVRVVAEQGFKKSKFESSQSLCKYLHWLPIQQRIDYKISLITLKCLQSHEPKYLFSQLNIKTSKRNLRSNNNGPILTENLCKSAISYRAFQIMPQSMKHPTITY